jgi:hypothetical protein
MGQLIEEKDWRLLEERDGDLRRSEEAPPSKCWNLGTQASRG